jgi:hypothetical protein
MKKTYYFYSKSDSIKEPINFFETEDIFDAIRYFSAVKNLSIDKFMDIYGVGTLDT